MAYLFFMMLSFFWGTSFILIKKAALMFGPFGIGGWRTLAGVIVIALAVKLLQRPWEINRKHFPLIVFLAVTGLVYPFTIQPHLITNYGSSFIAILVSLVPLFTLLFSIPLLKVWPSKGQLVGVTGGLVCLGILFTEGLSRSIPFWDLILASTVPLCYAFSNTCTKKSLSHLQPIQLSLCFQIITTTILLPISLTTEEVVIDENVYLAAGSLFILGVFSTGIGMCVFFTLIQKHGPLFAGMVTYVVPVIALVWGWIDSETINFLQIVALCGILASVALVQSSTLRSQNQKR